jgi:Ser/Thr protein kinase RdoA (MazF antagonist)
MTAADVSLSAPVAQQILRDAGITGSSGTVTITIVRKHNHVYRLQAAGQSYYLKTHTKHWYAGNPAAPGRCVDHEHAAWGVLASHGIVVPDVVLARNGSDNPFGRPFILTRALAGAPLTEHLAPEGGGRAIEAPLRAAGDYLRRMHAIRFEHPGYIMGLAGPAAPPATGAWQHRCWTAAARQAHALATLEAHRAALPPALVRRLETALSGIEVAAILPASTRWWEPLFAGYDREPDFDLFRLRLLAASPPEFAWMRPPKTRRSWRAVLEHLLAARTWDELFDGGW